MFKLLIYQPLFNLFIAIYLLVQNCGVAVIILTALIRFLLWPFFTQNEKNQRNLTQMQPEMKRIQKEHSNNYQQQTKDLLNLYHTYHINPSFTFLFLIIQLLLILALFNVFNIAVKPTFINYLYPIFSSDLVLNYMFLGIDLSQHSFILAFLASFLQVVQGYIMLKGMGPKDPQRNTALIMTLVMPILLLSIYKTIPAIIFLF